MLPRVGGHAPARVGKTVHGLAERRRALEPEQRAGARAGVPEDPDGVSCRSVCEAAAALVPALAGAVAPAVRRIVIRWLQT